MPYRHALPAVRLAGAACLLPLTVFAQPAAPVKSLDTIVVTAAGFEQEIKEAPASISVITREELDNRYYRDVTDALRSVPGVIVTGGSDRTDISLRGMGSAYTLILVDGKRQSSRETRTNSDGPGIEQGWTPPLEAIERIEVVRGPMSSLYGSDAMGGVINIITRKVAPEWGGSVRVDTTLQQHSDSGNVYQGNVYLSGPIKTDTLGLQIYGQYYHRAEDDILNGYSKNRLANGTAKLAFTPNRDHDIVLEAGTSRQVREGTPGKTVALETCSRGSCSPSQASENDYRRQNASITHTGRWGVGTSSTYLQREKSDNRTRDMQITNTVLDSSLVAPLGDAHIATAGLSYRKEDLHDGTGNQVSDQTQIDRYQWALFAEDEWSLTDTFALTGGVRMDRDENYGTHWSPRLYGVWSATDNWTVKGGVSTGFRAPSLRQTVPGWGQVSRGGNMYGNPDLKPETSVNQELGVIYDTRNGLLAGVTLFNNDFKDKITRVACPLTQCTAGPNQFGSNPTTYVNVDEAVTRGVEATLSADITRTLSVSSSYTYTYSKQKTGPNAGQPLNQLPEHLFSLGLKYAPNDRLGTWARLTYRGKEGQPVTAPSSGAPVRAPSWTTVDFGGSYDVSHNTQVFAGIYNLFDSRPDYDSYGYVEDGRRFWLGMNVKF